MANILIRTCWNTFDYQEPSGTSYKAEGGMRNYVKEEGFGMEEWNFNRDDLVDGSLYGYIRPNFNSLASKFHNIWFYSISPDKSLYLIGEYRDAYFLTPREREVLEARMQELGLLEQRIDQVYTALQASPDFNHVTRGEVSEQFIGYRVFKLKVSPDNAILYPNPIPFDQEKWDSLSPDKQLNKRYNGYNFVPDVKLFRGSFF